MNIEKERGMWKMPGNNLDETSKQKQEKQEKKKKKKKQNQKQKKVGVEVMTAVAVAMVVMRHRWVIECPHQAEYRLPNPILHNTPGTKP